MALTAPSLVDIREGRDALARVGALATSRLASALDSILHGVEPSDALGLRSVGGRSPLAIDRENRRDDELRRWRSRHLSRYSAREAATAIERAWALYTLHRLARDRELVECPYSGGPDVHCFALAKIGASIPSADRIRKIIAVGREGGLAMPHEAHETGME
jgi:hypothetical protein